MTYSIAGRRRECCSDTGKDYDAAGPDPVGETGVMRLRAYG